MKLTMLVVFAALAGFSQTASADEVYSCKGKTFFGEVTRITVTYEEYTETSMEIEYIDHRGKVRTDTGKPDPETRMKDFRLKRNGDFLAIVTSMSVVDLEGRRLRKVQIKDVSEDASMSRYNHVLCLKEETPEEEAPQEESSDEGDN